MRERVASKWPMEPLDWVGRAHHGAHTRRGRLAHPWQRRTRLCLELRHKPIQLSRLLGIELRQRLLEEAACEPREHIDAAQLSVRNLALGWRRVLHAERRARPAPQCATRAAMPYALRPTVNEEPRADKVLGGLRRVAEDARPELLPSRRIERRFRKRFVARHPVCDDKARAVECALEAEPHGCGTGKHCSLRSGEQPGDFRVHEEPG